MTNEEILATLIKADFCIEKAYWQIKNIPKENALRAGIADTLTQLLSRINDAESELMDIMDKIFRQKQ